MKRFTVTKTGDGRGGIYPKPLTFVATDDLAEAQRYVRENGGEVVDHETMHYWIPSVGWEPCDESIAAIADRS